MKPLGLASLTRQRFDRNYVRLGLLMYIHPGNGDVMGW